VGFGDDIIGSGMEKGLRGLKRLAFGDGKKIIWGPWSEEIFRHNPHIAGPGQENAADLHWLDYYKGHRKYNSLNKQRTRWVWNYDFTPQPGEIYFSPYEIQFAKTIGRDFIVIEPNVPWHKSVAVNKDWGLQRYQAVADRLREAGHEVVQFSHGRDRLHNVRTIVTPTFRVALAALSKAKFAVLPEGGLHHGAAALGVRAVVIFGGFIPPKVTGYTMHVNLTGGTEEACGSLTACHHCRKALDRITVDEVCGHVH
jgi:ADP-heptose:LPS heptosyltransferase